VITNPKQIPGMFATHFSSVFEIDTSPNIDNHNFNWTTNSDRLNTIGSVQFGVDEVKQTLKNLNTTKGAGPDGIHPLLLVNCVNSLALPLLILFNKSLETGTFPELWKQANVTLILKNGKRDCVDNYRPISILSTISKVFESLVHSYLYRHIHKHIIHNQFGFMAKRSTSTNLMLFTSEVAEAVDQGLQIDAVYADFSKAFDIVNHKILPEKLYTFGVTDNLLNWCGSYLSNRPSRVVIDGEQSDQFIARSGVPLFWGLCSATFL
jgi:hypothetical protein